MRGGGHVWGRRGEERGGDGGGSDNGAEAVAEEEVEERTLFSLSSSPSPQELAWTPPPPAFLSSSLARGSAAYSKSAMFYEVLVSQIGVTMPRKHSTSFVEMLGAMISSSLLKHYLA
ncbi:hypothetical protein Drorol1_Dr00026412 [Drosera rotundifolia]